MSPWKHLVRLIGVAFFMNFLPVGFSVWAEDGTQKIRFPDSRFSIDGFPWFDEDKPDLYRLPKRLKSTFRKEVWDLARDSSGGRICFRTDSEKLTLKAKPDDGFVMNHITGVAENGFDIYVDDLFKGSTPWVGKNGEIDQTWQLGPKGKTKEITLYMPLYKGITVQEIDLDAGAVVEPPTAFALPGPVVYYGTSITQGGCASNPGMSYPAIVSRRLNLDFVNLGFSGNGHGDESVAKAMAEIKASAFVLDYWANVSAEDMQKTLPTFVKILRQASTQTPILVLGPYYTVDGFNKEEKRVEEEFVKDQNKAGDRNIYFFDGLTMITEKTAYGLVDGIHANTLGFQWMADALKGPLKKALGLR